MMLNRVWPTVASRLPSELNLIIDASHGGKKGSASMEGSEGAGISLYSRSPSVFMNCLCHTMKEFWLAGKDMCK